MECVECYFIISAGEGHSCSLTVRTPDSRRIRSGRFRAFEKFRHYCFKDFNRPLTLPMRAENTRFPGSQRTVSNATTKINVMTRRPSLS